MTIFKLFSNEVRSSLGWTRSKATLPILNVRKYKDDVVMDSLFLGHFDFFMDNFSNKFNSYQNNVLKMRWMKLKNYVLEAMALILLIPDLRERFLMGFKDACNSSIFTKNECDLAFTNTNLLLDIYFVCKVHRLNDQQISSIFVLIVLIQRILEKIEFIKNIEKFSQNYRVWNKHLGIDKITELERNSLRFYANDFKALSSKFRLFWMLMKARKLFYMLIREPFAVCYREFLNATKITALILEKLNNDIINSPIKLSDVKGIDVTEILKSQSEMVTDKAIGVRNQIKRVLTKKLNKISAAIFFNFNTQSYYYDDLVLNYDNLKDILTDFWFRRIIPLRDQVGKNDTHFIAIQLRIKTETGEWRNLGHYTSWTINELGFKQYLTFLTGHINTVAGHYFTSGLIISQVDISWKFLEQEDSILKLKTSQLQNESILQTKNFSKWMTFLPLTIDYGGIPGAIIIKPSHGMDWFIKNVFIKNLVNDGEGIFTTWKISPIIDNLTQVTVANTDGVILAVFTDHLKLNEDGSSTVTRKFADGSEITFDHNTTIEQQAKLDSNSVFMQKNKSWSWNDIQNSHFLTYDIETTERFIKKAYVIGAGDTAHPDDNDFELDASGAPIKKLEIVSISLFYNTLHALNPLNEGNLNEVSQTFFINDYNNEEEMVRDFFNCIKEFSLNITKNSNMKKVYIMAHNSSKFDMVFLLKYLIEMEAENTNSMSFLMRNKKFLAVDWKVKSEEEQIIPIIKSAEELMNSGEKIRNHIITIKFMDSYLMLPMSLAKAAKQFNVESKGDFDFDLINHPYKDIVTMKNLLNGAKDDLLKYNLQDSRVLWYVMANFAKTTVDEFAVNIFKHPTSASIAFATFKTNYIKPEDHKIAITSKHIYDVLSPAYMGGACDVYNPQGNNIHTYDINSEYPAMMATKLMPTGIYKHIIGPIDITSPDLIAFVKAHITAPTNIKVPLLAMNVNGKMIAGVGSFSGIYFSQELRYALSLGYIIQPYEAYIYEPKLIFDEFINDMYKKRLSYDKSNPMNYICKLIMNSTYGRFGMAPNLTEVRLLNPNDVISDLDVNSKFTDITKFNDNLVMVTSVKTDNIELSKNANKNLQISLPIAAAITSYARICIHTYKQLAADLGILLYSDTDSIITSGPIPDAYIGKELGQMKLENKAEKGIFLSPKVYALHNVLKDGITPINDIIKAKGMKSSVNLTFEDYTKLLDKNEVYRTYQEKWFRSIGDANIKIRNLSSMIRINEGKRVIVTDLKDQFITTMNVEFSYGLAVSPNVIKLGLPVVYDSNTSLIFPTETQKYLNDGLLMVKIIAERRAAKSSFVANLYKKAVNDNLIKSLLETRLSLKDSEQAAVVSRAEAEEKILEAELIKELSEKEIKRAEYIANVLESEQKQVRLEAEINEIKAQRLDELEEQMKKDRKIQEIRESNLIKEVSLTMEAKRVKLEAELTAELTAKYEAEKAAIVAKSNEFIRLEQEKLQLQLDEALEASEAKAEKPKADKPVKADKAANTKAIAAAEAKAVKAEAKAAKAEAKAAEALKAVAKAEAKAEAEAAKAAKAVAKAEAKGAKLEARMLEMELKLSMLLEKQEVKVESIVESNNISTVEDEVKVESAPTSVEAIQNKINSDKAELIQLQQDLEYQDLCLDDLEFDEDIQAYRKLKMEIKELEERISENEALLRTKNIEVKEEINISSIPDKLQQEIRAKIEALVKAKERPNKKP